MGRRGPRPEPVETLRLRGSIHAYERDGEPSIVAGTAVAPEWLSAAGRLQWDRMVSRLTGMQVMSEAWREGLAQFCHWWGVYEDLIERTKAAEYVVETTGGRQAVNPLFRALSEASDKVMKLGREFGYTPASKADIRVEKKGQETDKKRFFKGA